jgi:hypothetical protein
LVAVALTNNSVNRGGCGAVLNASRQPLIKAMAACPVAVMKNQNNAAIQITVSAIPSPTIATGNLAVISRSFFVDVIRQIARPNLLKG